MFYLFSLLPLFPAKQIACASAKRAATRPQIHVKVRKKDIRCTSLYTHTHSITHICIPIYILYLYSALPRALRPNEPMNYFLPSSKFQGSSSSSTETDVALALRKLRKRKVLSICNATTITNEEVTVETTWLYNTLLSVLLSSSHYKKNKVLVAISQVKTRKHKEILSETALPC